MESLINRVHRYYESNHIRDGQEGRLTLLRAEEISEDGNVVAVIDSLNEVDIFFDLDTWKVVESAPSPYHLFLDGIRENADKNSKSKDIKGFSMTVIAESCWFPFHKRGRAHIETAKSTFSNYLIRQG